MADVNTITAETLEKLLEWAKNGVPGGDGPVTVPTNSITEAHLQNQVVSTRTIQDGAVTAAKLHPSIPLGGTTGGIADAAVTEPKIADNAVSTAKLQSSSINETKMQDNSISTRTIRNGSITAAKLDPSIPIGGGTGTIADGAVSEIKMQDNAVSTRTIQNLAITSAKLAMDSVTGYAIADGAVSGPHLDPTIKINASVLVDGSIVSAKLAAGSVPAQALQDNAVTTRAIANGAITAAKIDPALTVGVADNSITEPKYQLGSVSSRAVADGAITAAKLAPGVISGNANAELTAARQEPSPSGRTFATLKDRLDSMATSWVNVKWFGAKGDYSQLQGEQLGTGTDDSQAFKDAIAYIEDSTTRNSEFNDLAVRYALYIPGGRYLIKQPESLMLSTYALPAKGGLVMQGAGNPATEIIYDPDTPDTYLLNNQNAFNWITFRDIYFSSVGVARGALNNSFMLSKSLGQAQNYYFERCHWGGGWKEMLKLVGVDTNSEMTWMNCGFSEMFENAIHVPFVSGGTEDNSGSDQFVNYNFIATNYEVTRGTFLNFQKGGAINIWGGSLIYHGDNTGMETNGTMFVLGGRNHSQGSCRFHLEGVRMELPNGSAQFMNCQWNFGLIEIIGLDNAVQSWQTGTDVNNTVFDISQGAPIVTFTNCILQGRHKYLYGEGNYTDVQVIKYQNCEIIHYPSADEFIRVEGGLDPLSNYGSIPPIDFEGCKGNGGWEHVFDCTLNWWYSARGMSKKRTVRFSGPRGFLGAATNQLNIYMPLNCLITKIIYNVIPGRTVSTQPGWQYYVNTLETTPTRLATAIPMDDNPSHGIFLHADVNFFCDSDLKRHLVATSNSSASVTLRGICAIEYMGG